LGQQDWMIHFWVEERSTLPLALPTLEGCNNDLIPTLSLTGGVRNSAHSAFEPAPASQIADAFPSRYLTFYS
jgi:hypothetical protein